MSARKGHFLLSPACDERNGASGSLLAYASGSIKTHVNFQAPPVPMSTDCHAHQSHWALLAHKPPSGSSYLPDSSPTMRAPRLFQSCPPPLPPIPAGFFITSKACFSLPLRWPWQSRVCWLQCPHPHPQPCSHGSFGLYQRALALLFLQPER